MSFQLIAAPHTPFDSDGELNLDAVENQAALLKQQGASGVFICGSTGECESLTVDERKQMTERWSRAAKAAGLRLMVHVGRNATRDASELAAHAGRFEVDAIATLAPSYFKPQSVADLVAFCEPIAAASPETPFFFYDIPGMTGVSLSTVDFLQMAAERIPNLAGVKFTNPDLALFQECLRFDGGRYEILFGRDEALLAGRALGARGAVGSTYNYACDVYLSVIEALDGGDGENARMHQAEAVELVRTLEPYGFLAASKFVMEYCGIDCGPVREPLRNLTENQRTELREKLRRFTFLSQLVE